MSAFTPDIDWLSDRYSPLFQMLLSVLSDWISTFVPLQRGTFIMVVSGGRTQLFECLQFEKHCQYLICFTAFEQYVNSYFLEKANENLI